MSRRAILGREMAHCLLRVCRSSPEMALLPRHARQILFFTGGVALCGMVLAGWLGGTVAGQPDPRNTYSAFYVLFARDEFWGLGLVATFCLSAALFFSEKMV